MTLDGTASAPRPRAVPVVLAVALVALCWILGNPRSAGPDEPSHMVASAGLVRGQGDGEPNPDDPATRLMEVPAMVGSPDPVCWAFDPTQTPACAADIPLTTETTMARTTSFNYPPWGLVLPGLASFVPWAAGYAYLARAFGAALPVALVSAALLLAARRRPMLPLAILLGLTPIAWFTFGTVNPSALAIGGGVALWTGLLLHRAAPWADVVAVAGWAAVLLPRRDGPVWATLIVLMVCLALGRRPVELWETLRTPLRYLALGLVAVPVVTIAARSELDFDLALSAATLSLVAVEWFLRAWATESRRPALGVAAATALVVVAVGVMVARPGGADGTVTRLVVDNTGDHLVQLVGILGWLNAPVPMFAVLLFWATVGALTAVAWAAGSRTALVAPVGLALAIVTAWMLELGQGSTYGEYWQGRYTMPFAVGIPLAVAVGLDGKAAAALAKPVAVIVWLIANLAFFSAQRRWGIGDDRTWDPRHWIDWGAPVRPVLLIVAHAAAMGWLVALALTGRRTVAAAPGDGAS